MKFEFMDEDLLVIFQLEDESTKEDLWKLYFDGASNALGHGIGAILISLKRKYYPFTAKLNFNCTNNVAEYEAHHGSTSSHNQKGEEFESIRRFNLSHLPTTGRLVNSGFLNDSLP